MNLSADVVANLLAASIAYHEKGEITKQSIQAKHLLQDLMASSKGFPGTRDNITWRVKFDYTVTEQGYSGDDTVEYQNPANIRQASVPWFELHSGITVTFTELKAGGINVTDGSMGRLPKNQRMAAATQLADIWEDKIEDMIEGRARSRESWMWADGTQDSKVPPGVLYWIVDDPTAAIVVGDIDQVANPLWANRANLSINATAANASNNNLINFLQSEWRQVTRYGGKPNKFYCGSDFLDQLEAELRARGQYTQTGWANSGGNGIAIDMDDIAFKGMKFVYEPKLDDLGYAKRCYMLDISKRGLQLRHMNGENDKRHNPARDPGQYKIYQANTWTGGLMCKKRNHQGVYAIV